MAEAIKCNPLDITSNITNGLWTGYWVSSTDNITCNDCILAIIWPSSSDFGLDACVVTVPNGTNIYVCGGGTTGKAGTTQERRERAYLPHQKNGYDRDVFRSGNDIDAL